MTGASKPALSMSELSPCDVELDLHGYHPDDICGEPLAKIMQTAWEAGATSIRLIHGHGRDRSGPVPFANTNTGYFGLRIREALRHDVGLRQWIKNTTLDCCHEGSTTIRLKRNPAPTRTDIDWNPIVTHRRY